MSRDNCREVNSWAESNCFCVVMHLKFFVIFNYQFRVLQVDGWRACISDKLGTTPKWNACFYNLCSNLLKSVEHCTATAFIELGMCAWLKIIQTGNTSKLLNLRASVVSRIKHDRFWALYGPGLGTSGPREHLIWPAPEFLLPKLEYCTTSRQNESPW